MAPRTTRWRVTSVALTAAFIGCQLLDFGTDQSLSAVEPRGAFAEGNPLLAQFTDPVVRQLLGLALKLALVTFVIWVAMLQRRRVLTAAVLVIGSIAGLFGAWSNTNPWWRS